MIEIDKKIEKIKKSCIETAKKESLILKQENDSFSNDKVNKMIEDYKEELANKYSSDLNKIRREYNKNLFDYEMQERMRINKFKKELEDNIRTEIVKEFSKFVDSNEYEEYLIRNINATLRNLKNHDNCLIYITEKDYEKYNEIVKSKFNLKIEKMENKNIGGTIIVNNEAKISIDNTIKNAIEEKLKTINF